MAPNSSLTISGDRPSEGSSSSSRRGARHQRAADGHHLLLAAGELARRLAELGAQRRKERQHHRQRLGAPRPGSGQEAADLQVLQHRYRREQAPALGHQCDAGFA
jgi:hypothetical protein